MGRPRSAQAHKSILDAAAQLFAERGIDATSMDAIAEVSGVSKATIYKHWQDKDALCLEVMGYLHGVDEEPPVFASSDFRQDLIAQLKYHPAAHRKLLREKVTPHMMAYAARNHAIGALWRARVIEPARLALTKMIQRGTRQGDLRTGIEPEIAIALLLGPLLYSRIFLGKAGGKIPRDLEERVVDAFMAAFGKSAPD